MGVGWPPRCKFLVCFFLKVANNLAKLIFYNCPPCWRVITTTWSLLLLKVFDDATMGAVQVGLPTWAILTHALLLLGIKRRWLFSIRRWWYSNDLIFHCCQRRFQHHRRARRGSSGRCHLGWFQQAVLGWKQNQEVGQIYPSWTLAWQTFLILVHRHEAERVAGGGVDKMGFGYSVKGDSNSKSDGGTKHMSGKINGGEWHCHFCRTIHLQG